MRSFDDAKLTELKINQAGEVSHNLGLNSVKSNFTDPTKPQSSTGVP